MLCFILILRIQPNRTRSHTHSCIIHITNFSFINTHSRKNILTLYEVCYTFIAHRIREIKFLSILWAEQRIMNTYIYLSQEDMLKLKKLAQTKQLSLSACVDIIAQEFQFFVKPIENYINKGNKKTMLHIRNKAIWPVNDKTATNCVYAYFHEDCLSFWTNKDGIKNAKRKIQSKMDTTYDPNYLKNLMIRTNYNFNKGQTA